MHEIPIIGGKALDLKTFDTRSCNDFNYEYPVNFSTESADLVDRNLEKLIPDFQERAGLHRYLGSCLLTHPDAKRKQEFLILVGDTNHCLALTKVLEQVFGNKLKHVNRSQLMNNSKITKSLADSHMLVCSEFADIESNCNNDLLSLISGENITIEHEGQLISITPACRIIIIANKMPKLLSTDRGVVRRKICCHLNTKIGEHDFDELNRNIDGVFTWIAHGARALLLSE